MKKFILGKKLGMTQIYDEDGNAVPTTLIEVGSVRVTQVLTKDKNKYSAVQVGFGSKKLNKPEIGHQKQIISKNKKNKNIKGFAYLREFKTDQELKVGDVLSVEQFEIGDKVLVRGITKGKGFQGVVKRHGFKGGPRSHGQKHTLRAPGSIGSAFPQRVLKGMRMAGRMGAERKTILNLKVVHIDKDNNLLCVKGAVPGNTGNYLEIIKR
jgi:large subunit ribosomal protein L3